ncbi:MAG: hypothetical protein J6D11_04790 [Clostridia bacterium]|nr:hypothetical protein [Clostridia bacterium]
MKRKLYRILSLALAVLISACIVGCVDTSTTNGTTDNSQATTDSTNGNNQLTTDSQQTTEDKTTVKEKTEYEVISNTCKLGVNSIGTVWIEGIVVVENTGTTNLYLKSGKFDIEDSEGHLVATEDYISVYPTVIAPGEKAIYYGSFSLDNGDVNAEYKIVPNISADKAKVPIERLAVSDFSISEDKYGYIKAIGRVENTTEEEQSLYTVATIMYDANENVIGVMYTYPDKLAPGAKTSFEMSNMVNYNKISFSDIARYEVIAYTYQLQF